MTNSIRTQRALISVSDKAGLIECATALSSLGVAIIATGNTFRQLQQQGIAATELSDHTNFPEIMDGRVKSLHPVIHGGILARRDIDHDTLAQHNIQPIDLVICNLYPFEQTIEQKDVTIKQAIEQIDIGGPTLIRAAAKNHRDVTVIVDPNDYPTLIEQLKQHGITSLAYRQQAACKAFQLIAHYDQVIHQYMQQQYSSNDDAIKQPTFSVSGRLSTPLRYGENPQQTAACYQQSTTNNNGLLQAELMQGKALSYNNLVDSDAALSLIQTVGTQQPACAIIKHATPCGVAMADNAHDAYQKAFASDSQSAFGGIIALNTTCDLAVAQAIIEQQFAEVILAPNYTDDALTCLRQKPSCRVLALGTACLTPPDQPRCQSISGGFLVQTPSTHTLTASELVCVTQRQPTQADRDEALFAWHVVKHVKSNAIVYTNQQQTLGIGGGQTSRVFSAQIAALRAEQASFSLQGAYMASDAFFPFADSVELAHQQGIHCIVQPGGSKRDDEVIACANKHNIIMLFTGQREFLH